MGRPAVSWPILRTLENQRAGLVVVFACPAPYTSLKHEQYQDMRRTSPTTKDMALQLASRRKILISLVAAVYIQLQYIPPPAVFFKTFPLQVGLPVRLNSLEVFLFLGDAGSCHTREQQCPVSSYCPNTLVLEYPFQRGQPVPPLREILVVKISFPPL